MSLYWTSPLLLRRQIAAAAAVVVAAAKASAREKKISTLKELLEKHPEFKEIFIDATEQELPKPKDKERRKDFYSGKRKRHTAKSWRWLVPRTS